MLLGAALCLQVLHFLQVNCSLIIPCLQSRGKTSQLCVCRKALETLWHCSTRNQNIIQLVCVFSMEMVWDTVLLGVMWEQRECPAHQRRIWGKCEHQQESQTQVRGWLSRTGAQEMEHNKTGCVVQPWQGISQPIAGEMASVMMKKSHFPGRAIATLLTATSCLSG